LNDDQVGLLNLASTLVFAVFCAAGGFISDRLGRLRSLAIFITLTAIPTIWFAWMLRQADWVMPVAPKIPNRPVPPDWLIAGLWAATLAFNAANGLMYGTRSAFYMDFCDPKVGATQFTGYMAMMNLTTSYTLLWQGVAIEKLGYPMTLLLDALFGLVCLPLLAVAARLPKPSWTAEPEATTVETVCPLCGAMVPAGSRDCPACGERLPE
jgi:PAT family beta-lactamase induction signal transducer AmpG